ncbi:hypothetical protein F66182_16304, partial [Fusarium sp. NRRL 66182]
MSRRSTRLSLGENSTTEVDTKRKRLSAGSTIKSTAKKSKYFEGSDTDESASDVDGDSGSSYEEEEAAHEDEDSVNEEEAFEDESEEEKPKKRGRGRPSGSAKTKQQNSDDGAEDSPAKKMDKGK